MKLTNEERKYRQKLFTEHYKDKQSQKTIDNMILKYKISYKEAYEIVRQIKYAQSTPKIDVSFLNKLDLNDDEE